MFSYELLSYDLLPFTIIYLRTLPYEHLTYDLFLYELLSKDLFPYTIICLRTFDMGTFVL